MQHKPLLTKQTSASEGWSFARKPFFCARLFLQRLFVCSTSATVRFANASRSCLNFWMLLCSANDVSDTVDEAITKAPPGFRWGSESHNQTFLQIIFRLGTKKEKVEGQATIVALLSGESSWGGWLAAPLAGLGANCDGELCLQPRCQRVKRLANLHRVGEPETMGCLLSLFATKEGARSRLIDE